MLDTKNNVDDTKNSLEFNSVNGYFSLWHSVVDDIGSGFMTS